MSHVIDCRSYSNLRRLSRVTCNAQRFDNNIKSQGSLSNSQLLVRVELLWNLDVQLSLLQERSFHELRRHLDLFQDSNGLWRCRGRLKLAEVDYGAKHPILLPRDHHFTRLIVIDAHKRVSTMGPRRH